MKQMKIALTVVLTILMGTTLTSCLNSDNGNSVDGYSYATVNDLSYGVELLLDNNQVFIPADPNILRNSDGSMPKRVFFSFKYKEGETFTEGKTKYDGIIIVERVPVVVREFCQPDTLGIPPGEGQPIKTLVSSNNGYTCWGANGYINIGFIAATDSKTGYKHFDMYPESVKDGILYMKLHQNQKVENGLPTEVFMNFDYLSKALIQEALGDEYDELGFINGSDTVKVVVVADGENEQIKTDAVKMRLMEY